MEISIILCFLVILWFVMSVAAFATASARTMGDVVNAQSLFSSPLLAAFPFGTPLYGLASRLSRTFSLLRWRTGFVFALFALSFSRDWHCWRGFHEPLHVSPVVRLPILAVSLVSFPIHRAVTYVH